MAEVKLICGAVAIIDDCDLPLVEQFRWHKDKDGYAVRNTKIYGDRSLPLGMHRAIMGIEKGITIDHIDRNPLNNSRSNLRFATRAENAVNTRKRKGGTSQFKGVTWHKQCSKWQVVIKEHGANRYLGLYECEHEAGHVYNKAALAAYGEFATLNPVGFNQRSSEIS